VTSLTVPPPKPAIRPGELRKTAEKAMKWMERHNTTKLPTNKRPHLTLSPEPKLKQRDEKKKKDKPLN
jgi:hypothetical protein